ncbi:MAG: sigma-70 family RNA polymerase sigma factor [Bacteroidia bacterium]|nr:sigma-70 family RNA polymerase sigma factor [Bacteroidia bacterium]
MSSQVLHKTDQQIEEEKLQIELAKQDPKQFETLYNKYFQQIFIFINRRTDNLDLSGDITSQVFLKAMLNLNKYQFKGVPFSAWLYRIALSEINQHYRENQKNRAISLEETDLKNIIEEAEENFSEEKTSALINAFQQLEEDQLQLIELRFFEKRSFKEIGEIMEITENNAKVKVYRVIDKLKNIMKS